MLRVRELRLGETVAGGLTRDGIDAVQARMRGAATLAHLWDAVAPAQCADAHAAAAVPISSACPLSVAAMLVYMVSQGPRCALCGRNCTWQAPLTHGRRALAVTCNLLPPILRGCALMDAAARCDATAFAKLFKSCPLAHEQLAASPALLRRDGATEALHILMETVVDTALLSATTQLDTDDGDSRVAMFLLALDGVVPGVRRLRRLGSLGPLSGDGLNAQSRQGRHYAWLPQPMATALRSAIACDAVATVAAVATLTVGDPFEEVVHVRLGRYQLTLLHVAARAGRARVVAWMVETQEGRAFDKVLPRHWRCPADRFNASVEACRSGSLATVEAFVRRMRAHSGERSRFHGEHMAAAIFRGHTHIVEFLLNEGVVDVTPLAVTHAMRAAVRTHDASTVRWLLCRLQALGLDVRLLHDSLAEAVAVGVLPTLVALVDAGAVTERWRGANGETLLHVAARARATSCARWLLDGGHVLLDAACASGGATALNVAVKHSATGVVNLLRRRGADLAGTAPRFLTSSTTRIGDMIAGERQRRGREA